MEPSHHESKKRIAILATSIMMMAVLSVVVYANQSTRVAHKFVASQTQQPEAIKQEWFPIENSFNVDLVTNHKQVSLFGAIIPNADPATFKVLGPSIFADKNSVYSTGGSSYATTVPGLSTKNISLISDGGMIVLTNDTQVYFGTYRIVPTEVVKDPRTLRKTTGYDNNNELLFLDQYRFYFITTADPPHFIAFSSSDGKFIPHSHYFLDGARVQYTTRTLTDADASTFTLVEQQKRGYGKDTVYDDGFPEVNYARDAQHVYYKGILIPGVDSATFSVYPRVYSQEYARDAVHVYFNGKLIQGADSKTFQPLDNEPYEGCATTKYGKDNHGVYFETERVNGADPMTFEALNSGYGADATHTYFETTELHILPKDLGNVCNYG